MAKYLLNRIMQTIALLLIVSLLSFFLVSLMPSDPVYAQFGTDITQEEYQVAFVRMGLDKPLWQLGGQFYTGRFRNLLLLP